MQLRRKKCIAVAEDGRPNRHEMSVSGAVRHKRECKRVHGSEILSYQVSSVSFQFQDQITVITIGRLLVLPVIAIASFVMK